ncbi:phage tail protein [Paenibacillus macquariensis]|uniref:Phage tail protein n=1 Tax=Paenibacillus macquariensis TaxID=948756 RepID=A0ABY1K796_9BACL|nr:phage tail protein [Paenibacillus macquariensis]MEC0092507.1 phage tail protein [Paenibacillus macquariensis]OAB35465.1 hypothetical protein PMSM_09420 [Paenibacillus macquariensis subsp. macquariensis]SIR35245.1 hypothetical protein SAMN05421578_111159 [Paenibacillus macquariensis]
MAQTLGLGSLGDIVFISTHYKIRTFQGFHRSSADRWANNEIILQKPRSQFLGPGLDTIALTVVFDVKYGMNPRKEMDKLVKYSRDGKVLSLVIGGKGLGVNKWKITGIDQDWTTVDNKGNLLKASMSLSLEEYV